MAAGWQEAAAQQAEEVSARVRQLVSTGLGLLRTELGVDLGLQPQRYPSWVFLAVPLSLGLLVLFVCAGALGRNSAGKKRLREKREDPLQLDNPVPLPKSLKADDPKKKNKKKPTEKPKQPNGRPVDLVEEDITSIIKKESLKQSLEADKKNEKAKKNKKKLKSDAKQTQQSSNQDKKEVEEGNWETKVSHREKRQQRKRDKGTDSDIVETISSVVNEQFTSGSSHSAGTRKSKAAWSNVDGRMTTTEQRKTSFTAMGLSNSVPASVSEPISQPTTSESQWDSTSNEPCIDDEWSGLNGLNSSDPTSDWNAPAEEWGNWGEKEPVNVPQAEEPEQLTKVLEEEKENEESSAQGAASSKTKKKKKKKKKQEESGSAQDTENAESEAVGEFHEEKTPAPPQPAKISPAVVVKASEPKKQPEEETRHHNVFTEPSVSVKHSISEKSPSQVQQQKEKSSSNSKQNSVPPPSQAKSEESWESPKQVKKKKKARRET